MRLGVMLPVMLPAPTKLTVFAFAPSVICWVAYFAGVILDKFTLYFYFTFTPIPLSSPYQRMLTLGPGCFSYAVDSYHSNFSEMLIAMNLRKAISFGMALDILEWSWNTGTR